MLFHEGDSGDKLYVVLDGKVKLGRTSSDGRENLLAILGPGQMFGELSLFDPGPRSATVTAVTDTTFASLSHEDLLRWLEGRPVVARGLLAQLAGRLRKANDVVADLVFSDVPGRVAKALLDLADRFGRTADDGVHVHHDLTQEELAQLVGASRETVNKALADFASRGWLRLEPRSVVIMDVERLARRPASAPRGRQRSSPARRSAARARQVGELGADRPLGGAPERLVDVRVDDLDDLAGQVLVVGVRDRDRRAGQGVLDLGEPLAAVGEVVVERAEGVVEHRAVRRPERGRPRRSAARARIRSIESKYGAELAVRVGDDRRAAAQHHVAGQQRAARRAARARSSPRCGPGW